MEHLIKWEHLLNETRPKYKYLSEKEGEDKKEVEADTNVNKVDLIEEHRNQFERDYDRIMSSSSLRRLQDKAQVFPLQDSDFIRTRLTHSMEVSAIARSFGTWLEKWLINEQEKLKTDDFGKIPAMLATAGLVHDIGNPPFGHYGEDIIKSWFSKYFEDDEDLNLEDYEQSDFLNFDGNAQAIRVLTRLQFLNDQFGINFTYGTLSILIKYPWSSSNKNAAENNKFGYFDQDKDVANDILKSTVGIEETRNPLTYLLEASDDIAYLGADIEDGVKKNIIPWEKVFNEEIANKDNEIYKVYNEDIDKLIKKHNIAKENNFPEYVLTSVQNFKVWAQGQMIREVKEVFVSQYDEIMNGTYKVDELLKETENAKLLRSLLKSLLKKYCFPNKEVLSLELVGDSVINDLLNIFVKDCIMCKEDFEDDHKSKAGKLYKMISDNFIFVHLLNSDPKNPKKIKKISDLSDYSKLLLITDFISGMTDSYAVDLHQKLKGVKMP
jgi:dGTPase